jgi:mannose-1-phosphate guanylyltransferase/mannose-6-phosphate isomerase
MVDHVLILAGGSGTRLWPASNSSHPKQFIPVRDGKSLLRLTIERAGALDISGDIVMITLRDQLDPILKESERITAEREKLKIIPEPAARNTAPAIAVAAEYLKAQGKGDDTVLVLPADHLISPVERFREDAARADELARQGYLVTFGIPPAYPATGYGYIESGDKIEPGRRVASFREKPDEKTAKSFVEAGNYYWNSGMFAFKVSTYLDELASHSPAIAETFDGIGKAGESRSERGIPLEMVGEKVEEIYKSSPKDSIDYAVMEKSRSSAMVEASFEWNDIGSWDEMAKLFEEGEGAAGEGENEKVYTVESNGNFVYSDLPVALCGVDDLMVVVKNGAVLVTKKGSGQLVKKVVEQIKEEGRTDIL